MRIRKRVSILWTALFLNSLLGSSVLWFLRISGYKWGVKLFARQGLGPLPPLQGEGAAKERLEARSWIHEHLGLAECTHTSRISASRSPPATAPPTPPLPIGAFLGGGFPDSPTGEEFPVAQSGPGFEPSGGIG